jgi:protein-tyrosine phosphatase
LLKRNRIDLVVNMWSKVDPDLSSEQQGFIYINWLCSPSVVPPDANLMTHMVASLIKAGHRALIHCEAGRGRSVWFSARVLSAVEGIPGAEALERVKAACPSYKINPPLIKDLKEFRRDH